MAKKTKIKIPLIIAAAIIIIIIVIGLVVLLAGKERAGQEAEKQSELEQIADKIYGFTAEIEKIDGKTLYLNGWVPKQNTTESARITVKGVVTDDTEIVKWKFPENLPQESGQRISAKKTPVTFTALQPGDKIEVAGFSNISENIKNNTEFDLKHIFIIER